MFASCLDHGQVAAGCFKVVLVFVASVQSVAEVDQLDSRNELLPTYDCKSNPAVFAWELWQRKQLAEKNGCKFAGRLAVEAEEGDGAWAKLKDPV